jgi:hypothetical protein
MSMGPQINRPELRRAKLLAAFRFGSLGEVAWASIDVRLAFQGGHT